MNKPLTANIHVAETLNPCSNFNLTNIFQNKLRLFKFILIWFSLTLACSLLWKLSFHIKIAFLKNVEDFWHFGWFRLRSFTAPYCPHPVLSNVVGPPSQWGKVNLGRFELGWNCDIKLDFSAFLYFSSQSFRIQKWFTLLYLRSKRKAAALDRHRSYIWKSRTPSVA